MKKRIITIVLVLFMLFLSGCDLFNKENGPTEPVDSLYEVYKLAAANGYEGTYEEWIESIRGENGKSIELVVDNNYLCYKYTGENILIPIYDLSQLMGEPGEQGAPGIQGVDGVSITKVEKTATDGLVDTYTITFSNGTTTTYTVNNGSAGSQGEKGDTGVSIVKVEKTATDGLVDTYTITFSNGTSTTYTVNNGSAGAQGEKGNGIAKIEKTSSPDAYTDIYTITFTDGSTFDFTINNGKPLEDSEYDVSFNSDGGSEVESQKVKFGYKVAKPKDPTLDGYDFDGWYIGDEKWSFSTTLVTETITLKAKWIPITFSITYNYNDGEEVDDAI
ncbi:MAG: InlB B-repeat-containing protein, partial [Bacilli bacterium]|nr:InlB B-repeat-containing protein [Bacilli bacterium]